LQQRGVIQAALVPFSPELRPGRHVDQFRFYLDFIAVLGYFPGQHRIHVQFASYSLRVVLPLLIARHRAACHDLKIGKPRQ
jgi:hypothetical protein